MVFNSLQYAVLLPVVYIIYWRLSRPRQNLLLLLASYVFYAAFDWRFLFLMWASTLVDFVVGRQLAVERPQQTRKAILATSLVVNLAILGFFKYFNFFVDSLDDVLERLGLEWSSPALRILLPVGISFYTFHGISYTVDVYRRRVRAATSLVDFAVFVAFFPQLVAGPIGRAELQLPQFQSVRVRPDAEKMRSACFLILLGLFRKVVIADGLAPFVNDAFHQPARHGSLTLLLGVYAFALQIFCDFAGYSDIARGSSRLLGIELPVNFSQPYLSRNITTFWRRWHISLSNWLRDYLYIPLGGNRGSTAKTYRNLMLTMVLGGLWHGAAAKFIVWGALHGGLLAIERAVGAKASDGQPRLRDLLAMLYTFHAVCFAWIFFRAGSLGDAVDHIRGIGSLRGGAPTGNHLILLALASSFALAVDLSQRKAAAHESIIRWKPVYRGVSYGAMAALILVFSGGTPVPFIYFQF